MGDYDYRRGLCTSGPTNGPGACVMPEGPLCSQPYGNAAAAEAVANTTAPGDGVLLNPGAPSPPSVDLGPEWIPDPEANLTPLPGTGDIASQPTQYEIDSQTMTPAPSQAALDRQNEIIEYERQQRRIRQRREANRERRRAETQAVTPAPESSHDVHQAGGVGPYRWSHRERASRHNMGGESGGFGLFDEQGTDGGLNVGARYTIGHGSDMEGNDEYGLHVQGGLTGAGDLSGGGDNVTFEGGALNFDAGIYGNDSTFTMGAQANALEVAAELAMDSDPNRDTDTSIRGGLSAGEGLALRLHYGDADGDGVREYGIGGDLLVGSGDIRSEQIHRFGQFMSRQYTNLGDNVNAIIGHNLFD